MKKPDPQKEPMPHNPDNLTAEQIGVAQGWRLLNEEEIIPYGPDESRFICEGWLRDHWEPGCLGSCKRSTYRTQLSPADLRKARNLPEQSQKGGGEECQSDTHAQDTDGRPSARPVQTAPEVGCNAAQSSDPIDATERGELAARVYELMAHRTILREQLDAAERRIVELREVLAQAADACFGLIKCYPAKGSLRDWFFEMRRAVENARTALSSTDDLAAKWVRRERTWPSCGHTSPGVCFECYSERGKTLARVATELDQLRAKLAEANKARDVACQAWAQDDTEIKAIAEHFGIKTDDDSGYFISRVSVMEEMANKLAKAEQERDELAARVERMREALRGVDDAISTCVDHCYSDGMVHHQSFNAVQIGTAQLMARRVLSLSASTALAGLKSEFAELGFKSALRSRFGHLNDKIREEILDLVWTDHPLYKDPIEKLPDQK